jgi:hypothetical protein
VKCHLHIQETNNFMNEGWKRCEGCVLHDSSCPCDVCFFLLWKWLNPHYFPFLKSQIEIDSSFFASNLSNCGRTFFDVDEVSSSWNWTSTFKRLAIWISGMSYKLQNISIAHNMHMNFILTNLKP